ncbi:hypothetical protein Tco_0441487 [Tanacetum coccineum]
MDAASMTFDEVFAWEKEESLSPLLRTPHLKPRIGIDFPVKNHSFKGFDWIDEPVGSDDHSLPGKSKDEFSNEVILDDVVSSPATTLSLLLKRKGKSRVKFTRIRAIIKRSTMISLRKSLRSNYGRFVTVIGLNEDDLKDTGCSFNNDLKDHCLKLLHTDNDVHSFFDAALKNGSIHLYVAHKKQNLGKYYYKNMEWEEDDAGLRYCSSTPFDTRFKRKISKSKKTGVIHDEGAGRKRKKSLVNRGNKGKEKVFEDEGADKKQKKTLVNGGSKGKEKVFEDECMCSNGNQGVVTIYKRAMVNGKAKMVEVVSAVKTGRNRGVVIGALEAGKCTEQVESE